MRPNQLVFVFLSTSTSEIKKDAVQKRPSRRSKREGRATRGARISARREKQNTTIMKMPTARRKKRSYELEKLTEKLGESERSHSLWSHLYWTSASRLARYLVRQWLKWGASHESLREKTQHLNHFGGRIFGESNQGRINRSEGRDGLFDALELPRALELKCFASCSRPHSTFLIGWEWIKRNNNAG